MSNGMPPPQQPPSGVKIGKIVKSNTHIDYVCQVYGRGEAKVLPQPGDYTFGTFAAIQLEEAGAPAQRLVGIVYTTILMNPEFGALGPRLSPPAELEVFTPDYMSETATLVGIIAVGWQEAEGYRQGVPVLAATVNNSVRRLSDDEVRAFHTDARGRLCLRYAPILMGMNNPLVAQLLINVVDRLHALFPAEQRQLGVMRNNLAWKSIVEPAR
jgi:hypothetical protein